jgi:hypothetical protein
MHLANGPAGAHMDWVPISGEALANAAAACRRVAANKCHNTPKIVRACSSLRMHLINRVGVPKDAVAQRQILPTRLAALMWSS